MALCLAAVKTMAVYLYHQATNKTSMKQRRNGHMMTYTLNKFPCKLGAYNSNVHHFTWIRSHRCSKRSAISVSEIHSFLNTLRSRQDGRHFPDDIFKCIFVNGNWCILITISLKYVRKGPIYNNSALVQIMALVPNRRQAIIWTNDDLLWWRICTSRPQWVKSHEK